MSAPEKDVPASVSYREVQEILRTFRDSAWRSITLDLHGMRITVGKDAPPAAGPQGAPPAEAPAPAAPAPAEVTGSAITPSAPVTAAPTGPAAPPIDTAGCVAVRSPAVGAFWIAPSPGQPSFVQVGQVVAQDEQLAIVEVMKLMNPVVAPAPGEVVAVCAANADLVEYEQVLFWIRPADG